MVQHRSNVGLSLNKKRHTGLIKKIFAYFIFALFFISLSIYGLTREEIIIKDIKVSGNSSVSTEDIMKIVENKINKNYLYIIRTDNILLLRRSEIKNDILNSIKKIGEVTILMKGINNIEIVVKERESKNLWCNGTPALSKKCYFMDSDGFIFEEAAVFSTDAFPKYFGLITEENPLGQLYLKNNFPNISSLFNKLKEMSFEPKYLNAQNEHEYEVYILGDGKIIMNDKKSFESSLSNLQALLNDGYIKNDVISLPKIKYIDLRFGNKVNFELNK
jgi:cell division septal protein FtsQ